MERRTFLVMAPPATVRGLNPTQIAYQLVAMGGLESGATLRLVSCNTAFSKFVFWQDSYAKKLKNELAASQVDCIVVGQAGIATVDNTGSIRTLEVVSWKDDPKNKGMVIPDRTHMLDKGVGKRVY
jgi:hypothetical protein